MTLALNYLIKNLIIEAGKMIEFKTEDQEANFITYFIFVAQFFNTGILILLTNANL